MRCSPGIRRVLLDIFTLIKWTFIEGFGGQIDFIRGAAQGLDGEGKAIIAMPSSTKRGESKIVPILKEGKSSNFNLFAMKKIVYIDKRRIFEIDITAFNWYIALCAINTVNKFISLVKSLRASPSFYTSNIYRWIIWKWQYPWYSKY